MKFLLSIVLVFTMTVNQFSTSLLKSEDVQVTISDDSQAAKENTNSFIVVEDMIALVGSGDPTNPVTAFEVFDDVSKASLFLSVSGCSLPECRIDLSSLPSGNYYAEATTANGSSFGECVEIE